MGELARTWPGRGGLWASTPGCLSRNHLLPAGWSQAPSTPMGRGCGQLGGFGVDRGRQDSHGRSVQGALPAGASPAASQRGQGQDTAGQPGPRVRWPRSAARRGLGVTGPQGQHGQGPSCPRLVLPGRQRWGQLHGGGGQQSEWLQMARLSVSKATGGGDTGVGRVGGLKVTACCEDGGVATVTGHVTGLEARQSRAWT